MYKSNSKQEKAGLKGVRITNTEEAHKHIRQALKKMKADQSQEHTYIVGLNTHYNVTFSGVLFIGGINSCSIDIRLIFKNLILNDATMFIIAHNHPSGSTEASEQDMKAFQNVQEVGQVLDIKLVDSLILNTDFSDYSTIDLDI